MRDAKNFVKTASKTEIRIGRHCSERCKQRNISTANIKTVIANTCKAGANIFEVEVAPSGDIYKVVMRFQTQETNDTVVVLTKIGNGYMVKTAWNQLHTDKHITLNEAKYCKC